MILTLENFDATLKGFDEVKTLGQLAADNRIRIEFTLCHPHTKPWCAMSDNAKVNLYYQWYASVLNALDLFGTLSKITFENRGQPHLHAHGYFEFDSTHVNASAYCCMLTDMWLSYLPKRYDHCLKGSTYDNYNAWSQRIAIPQCCIQFRSYEKKRAEFWDNYIIKEL